MVHTGAWLVLLLAVLWSSCSSALEDVHSSGPRLRQLQAYQKRLVQGSEAGTLCFNKLVQQLGVNYTGNATATSKQSLKLLVSRSYASCLETADKTTPPAAARILLPNDYFSAFSALIPMFAAANPTLPPIALTPVDLRDTLDELLFELDVDFELQSHDGWIFPWVGAVQLAYSTVGTEPLPLADLDDPVFNMTGDPVMNWSTDVPDIYKQMCKPVALKGANKPQHNVYVPLQGGTRVMYYRSDILQERNLPVPRTWSEVLAVATAINGTVDPLTNQTMWGVCMDPNRGCSYAWLMGAVASPYLQTETTSQGVYLSVGEGLFPRLRYNSSGSLEAFKVFESLTRLSPPPSPADEAVCTYGGSGYFQEGLCAVTFLGGFAYESVELVGPGGVHYPVKGRYGIAELPGSERVQLSKKSKGQNLVVPCTDALCPYGIGGVLEKADILTLQGIQPNVTINRAPALVTGGLFGAVNSATTLQQQLAAYKFLAFISSTQASLLLAQDRTTPTRHMRPSVFEALQQPPFSAIYDVASTKALQAALTAEMAHPNQVRVLDVPGYDQILKQMDRAAQAIVYGSAEPQATLDMLQASVMNFFSAADPALFSAAYVQSIYRPFGERTEITHSVPLATIILPILCFVLVVLISTFYEILKLQKHTSLFGKVVAPGPSADTTLLITDIQDSTLLWEVLPPNVMDKAIKEHHQCIRRLLLKHSGYESATEGDSFILAFHCAEDALMFAMDAQVALLERDWPQELLEHELARPCFVTQVGRDQREAMGVVLEANSPPIGVIESQTSKGSSALPASPTAAQQPTVHSSAEEVARPHQHALSDGSGRPLPAAVTRLMSDPTAIGAVVILPTSGLAVPAAILTQGPPLSPRHPLQDHACLTPVAMPAATSAPVTPFGSSSALLPVSLPPGLDLVTGGGRASPTGTFKGLHSLLASSFGSATSTRAAPCRNLSASRLGGVVLVQAGVASQPQASVPLTFHAACKSSWKEAANGTAGSVLVFRGLRVRMGLHTGITNEADVAYNTAAARMHYSGEIMSGAKAVSDMAAGGMTLLSEATYMKLPMERLWDKAMVMHIGEYMLQNLLPINVYNVSGRRLMGRLGFDFPLRFKQQLSGGVHAAPLGSVAVAFMQVVGAGTLLAWNERVARAALRLCLTLATAELQQLEGYLVESTDERIVAVFHGAAEAVAWALATHEGMLHANWAPELLDHELAEELIVGDTFLFRGLRLKSGIDCGVVVGEVNAFTGRISYRGKALQRAERTMQAANSNQVLCSHEVWASALCSTSSQLLQNVEVERMPGPIKLRGGTEKSELLLCRLTSAHVPAGKAQSQHALENIKSWNAGIDMAWPSPLAHEVRTHQFQPLPTTHEVPPAAGSEAEQSLLPECSERLVYRRVSPTMRFTATQLEEGTQEELSKPDGMEAVTATGAAPCATSTQQELQQPRGDASHNVEIQLNSDPNYLTSAVRQPVAATLSAVLTDPDTTSTEHETDDDVVLPMLPWHTR